MTILDRIIKGFLTFITNLIKSVSSKAKELIPVAITIVNAIKFAIENPITGNIIDYLLDAVKKSIPGEADDVLIDKAKAMLEEWLPKILDRLKVAEGIANIVDTNERYLAIFNQIKFENQEVKTLLYNDLACIFATKLTDDSLTLNKALITVPIVYKNPEVLNA